MRRLWRDNRKLELSLGSPISIYRSFSGTPKWLTIPSALGLPEAHILRMTTIVQCDCGAEYKRTETKFLVPHTGHAPCKVCGATLESWVGTTHERLGPRSRTKS